MPVDDFDSRLDNSEDHCDAQTPETSDDSQESLNSLLELTRSRFQAKECFTSLGRSILLAIKPYSRWSSSLVSDSIADSYRTSKNIALEAPHLFSIAEQARRGVLNGNNSHCILELGNANSGKFFYEQHLIRYLFQNTNSHQNGSREKEHSLPDLLLVLKAVDLINAFSLARLPGNSKESIFGKSVEFCFNSSSVVERVIFQPLLLNALQLRRVFSENNDQQCRIMMDLCIGAPNLLKENLRLTKPEDYRYLCPTNFSDEDDLGFDHNSSLSHKKSFALACRTMSAVGIQKAQQLGIFKILATILHIGNIEIELDENKSLSLTSDSRLYLENASHLLSIQPVLLKSLLLENTHLKANEDLNSYEFTRFFERNRDSFCGELFKKLIFFIFERINCFFSQNIPPKKKSTGSIMLMDIDLGLNSRASQVDQLFLNYLNDKFAEILHHCLLLQERDQLRNDGINSSLNIPKEFFELSQLFENVDCGMLNIFFNSVGEKTVDNFVPKIQKLQALLPGKLKIIDDNSSNVKFSINHFTGETTYSQEILLKQLFLLKNSSLEKSVFASVMDPTIRAILNEKNSRTVRHESSHHYESIERKYQFDTFEGSSLETSLDQVEQLRGDLNHIFLSINSSFPNVSALVNIELMSDTIEVDFPVKLWQKQIKGLSIYSLLSLQPKLFLERMTINEFFSRYHSLVNKLAIDSIPYPRSHLRAILSRADVDEPSYKLGKSFIHFLPCALVKVDMFHLNQLQDDLEVIRSFLRPQVQLNCFKKLKESSLNIQCQFRVMMERKRIQVLRRMSASVILSCSFEMYFTRRAALMILNRVCVDSEKDLVVKDHNSLNVSSPSQSIGLQRSHIFSTGYVSHMLKSRLDNEFELFLFRDTEYVDVPLDFAENDCEDNIVKFSDLVAYARALKDKYNQSFTIKVISDLRNVEIESNMSNKFLSYGESAMRWLYFVLKESFLSSNNFVHSESAGYWLKTKMQTLTEDWIPFKCLKYQIDYAFSSKENQTFQLKKFLHDSELRGLFQDYLAKFHSKSHIDFLEKIDDYRNAINLKERKSLAVAIVDSFIRENSCYKIEFNVDAKTKIFHHIQTGKYHVYLFDEVYDTVYSNLDHGAFKKFLESNRHNNCIRSKIARGLHLGKGWTNSEGYAAIHIDIIESMDIITRKKKLYCVGIVDSLILKTSYVQSSRRMIWSSHLEFPICSTSQRLELQIRSSPKVVVGYIFIQFEELKHPAQPKWYRVQTDSSLNHRGESYLGEVLIEISFSKDQAVSKRSSRIRRKRSSTFSLMSQLRGKFSDHLRYQSDGFDLDLGYITEHIMAMSCPAPDNSGVGILRGDPISEIASFLESRHSGHYRIYSLIGRAKFDTSILSEGSLIDFPVPKEYPGEFHYIHSFCEDVQTWLNSHPQNVVILFCEDGEQRSGYLVSCLLLFLQICKTVSQAMDRFIRNRFILSKRKGILLSPSQQRYVGYVAELVKSKASIIVGSTRIRSFTRESRDLKIPPRLNSTRLFTSMSLTSIQKAHSLEQTTSDEPIPDQKPLQISKFTVRNPNEVLLKKDYSFSVLINGSVKLETGTEDNGDFQVTHLFSADREDVTIELRLKEMFVVRDDTRFDLIVSRPKSKDQLVLFSIFFNTRFVKGSFIYNKYDFDFTDVKERRALRLVDERMQFGATFLDPSRYLTAPSMVPEKLPFGLSDSSSSDSEQAFEPQDLVEEESQLQIRSSFS